jgi:flagellar hook-associated protein 2
MGITPLTLSGVSQYSSDLQNILNRAVQIAQVPVQQLQNRDSDLLQQKTLLGSLRSTVGDLATSLASLGDIANSKAIAATSSDSSVAIISATAANSAATYTINSVTSTATVASERSLNGYPDSASMPVSSTGQMQLTVGSHPYSFDLAANTLIGLRDKINSLGAGVNASILTTGNGNYLSVTADSAGQTTLQLLDDPSGAATQMLTQTNQGSDTVFQLNGITVTEKSNIINSVIPGITFELLKPSSTPVTISLSSDRSKLSTALQDFVQKYNALKSQIDAQTGKNAGLLTGDTAVTGLSRTLREVTSYQVTTGQIHGLADLGITFDSSGKASFDAGTFQSLSDSAVADGFSFIGSATSGLGGFSQSLNQYADPISGFIRYEQDGIDRTDQSIQNQTTVLTDRINQMQTQLQQRLALADSLLSQLESQQKSLTASLQGLNLVLYGKSAQQ